ncbi:MAG: DUF1127 domain-containing protein [Gammaproteobacteria bacterium]|nr:DUF1127 domain-containing protein [Gammaproteobacteria bacterium]
MPGATDKTTSIPQGVVAFFMVCYRRASQRRQLAAMDDRMLKDIGISRVEALDEAAKPFWRA